MIVLRSPKGWTGPPKIDGKQCEDYWRSHQVPLGDMDKPGHVKILEQWMKSYRPGGAVRRERPASGPSSPRWRPKGERRMGANPHANGGLLLRDLRAAGLPRLRGRRSRRPARSTPRPRACRASSSRDVMKLNLDARNFRVFSPDENASNRWQDRVRRDRTAASSARSCRPTTTSRPTAA